jgi:hypothetical protein
MDGGYREEVLMRALIAFSSCEKYAVEKKNQALRDTFLKDVPMFPDLEYKIFIGDGTPIKEDTSALQMEYDIAFKEWTTRFPASPAVWEKKDKPQRFSNYAPESDEVILHVPDDYKNISYKTREGFRWAVQHGFDFIFQACPDTYTHIPRLMTSRFEAHSYTGRALLNPTPRSGRQPYGQGGPGFWISALSAQHLVDAPVTDWAPDRWVGTVLYNKGIRLYGDNRYVDYPQRPQNGNDFITSHLACVPTPYDVRLMYSVYEGRPR